MGDKLFAVYAAGERGAKKAVRDGVAAVVVVDAFRASTTIAVLVKKGARVIPVASIGEAASYAGSDYRIGERCSAKVEGFDFGNSPTEVEAAEIVSGATVVLSTTNGTRVIEAARGVPAIFAGAFVNANAVADALAKLGSRVAVIGCGWEGHRASEDESAAGAILHRLREGNVELDERAERVADLYLSGPKNSLRKNSAARRLERLGFMDDVEFCLAENTVPVVPHLVGEAFVSQRYTDLGARAARSRSRCFSPSSASDIRILAHGPNREWRKGQYIRQNYP